MGSYTQYITNEGESLIARALSGSALTFTEVVTSSALTSGTEAEIKAYTELADIRQRTVPSAASRIGDQVIRVSAAFENTTIESAYAVQSVGLFAKIDEEPQKLFAIAQAQKPSEMPAASEASYASLAFNFNITVQRAEAIAITVTPGGALPSDIFYSMFPGLTSPSLADVGKVARINDKGEWEYVSVDSKLDKTSANPVQNTAVATELRKLTEEITKIKKLLPSKPPTEEDAGKVLKINADGQVTWAEDYGASWQARHPDFAHGSDTYSSSGNSHFETTYDNGDKTVTDRADDGTITEELYVDGVKVAQKETTSETTDGGKHIIERLVEL